MNATSCKQFEEVFMGHPPELPIGSTFFFVKLTDLYIFAEYVLVQFKLFLQDSNTELSYVNHRSVVMK